MKTLPQNFFIKNDGSEKFKQYMQYGLRDYTVLTLDEFFDIIEPKKELPKSFVILHDGNPEFHKFIEWMNTTYNTCYAGDCKNTCYGFLDGKPYWYGTACPKTITTECRG